MKNFLVFALIAIFTSTNAQWINQNAGFTNKVLGFYEFSIVNENTVWAICYDGINGLLSSNPVLDFTRTTDGGTTWIPGTMGTDATLAFSNITAVSATQAWVAMHRFGNTTGGGGGLFHTTDGGLNWIQSNPTTIFNSASFPNFVYFKDPQNGIAGGNVNDGYFEVYKTTDGGSNWSRTPQANFPELPTNGGTGWFDGYAVVGNTVWFGSTRSKVYKSTDFGTTWSIANVSTVAADRVYEIAFNDDALHGVCHTRNTAGTTKLFATADGGLTWTQRITTTIPNWRRDRITSIPGTNSFISTSTSAQSGSAVSTDNGLTWSLIESSEQKAACRFLNSTTGWSGGFFTDGPVFGNRDGIFKWDSTINLATNSNDSNQDNILFFPNPAQDYLILHFKEKIVNNVAIEIIDYLGRTYYKEKFDTLEKELTIDTKQLSTGNYIFKITTNDQIISKKIAIR